VSANRGTVIESVVPDSPAARAGIEKGDVLLSVNGHRTGDVIDYMFYKHEPTLKLVLARQGKKHSVTLGLEDTEEPGIRLAHFKVRTCKNKCIFCFVSQLPKGLRKTLYVRDEDYRMSFLYGNYVTLTGLSAEDRKRIAKQRLSPLYISVHATDKAVRNRILGNPRAADIMKEMRFLKESRIRMHTQIVLCPGVNDGDVLKKTIRDLYSLYPYVASIAVVPVGLTEHGKKKLTPVKKEDAEDAIAIIEAFQKRFRKKHGDRIVYASDELYIKAELPFPPLKEFGELPQIENGVGMVPSFLSRARRLKIDLKPAKRRFLVFTGTSFYPYLKRFTERLEKHGAIITVIPVENTFFGPSVTVTGLLTGRDVIKSMSKVKGKSNVLLIPDVALKDGVAFLDDVTVNDVAKGLGMEAMVIESTPDGLLKGLRYEN
jgi:putative radical SAM enzyme (TIGR03279 family)